MRFKQIEEILASLPGPADMNSLPQRSTNDWAARTCAAQTHTNYLLAAILAELQEANRNLTAIWEGQGEP